MCITNAKRMLGAFLALVLLCSVWVVIPQDQVYASSMTDIRDHWAEAYIKKAAEAGIINGYEDGSFLPDNPVSRAEFIHMLNAALKNSATTSLSFSDTPSGEWYYTDVAKGVAAGYISGYDENTFGPNDKITRQQAAVILAGVVPTYGSSGNLTSFGDRSQIADWAEEAIKRINGKGYLGAYDDGLLHPEDNLTRAQAAKIICDLLEKETIVSRETEISSSGTTLSDTIYSNGITVTSSVGNGSAAINNCVVLGTLNVNGGGDDGVTISNSRVSQAVVQRSANSAVVTVRGESNILKASVANSATIQTGNLSGGSYGPGFKTIDMTSNANVVYTGSFPEINITGSNCEATITSGVVDLLNITGRSNAITVETNATINNAVVNATATFHGNGTIKVMDINASGVTYSKEPQTVNVGKGVDGGTASDDDNSDIAIIPKNKATDVDTDTTIKLTFGSAMTLYNGKDITSSNIDDFVEVRKNSTSGTKINFKATINSSKKIITITPSSDLDDDTRYYVIIARNELKDEDGEGNAAFSSYFNTGSGSTKGITFSPKNNATGVSVDTTIKITFDEAIESYDGKSLTNSRIQDAVTLRKNNSSGTKVSFSASINSSNKTITITPSSDLAEDQKYYLAIGSKTLRTINGEDPIAATSITFTTGDDGGDITFSPRNGATGVAIGTTLKITFDEAVETYDGKSLTNSRIQDSFTLRKSNSSGSKVSFSGSINSNNKTITITPSSDLDYGQKYYLAINSKSLRTKSDGDTISAESITFTTVSSASTTATVNSISATRSSDGKSVSATFTGNYAGTIYAVIVPSSETAPTVTQVLALQKNSGSSVGSNHGKSVTVSSSGGSGSATFTSLDESTAYTIYAVLKSNSYGTSARASRSVATNSSAVTGAKLSALDITPKESISPAFSANTDTYTVEVANGTKEVKITATTTESNGTVQIDGGDIKSGSNTATISIGSDGTAKATIKVTGDNKTASNYTVNLVEKGNTDVSEVIVANGTVTQTGTTFKCTINKSDLGNSDQVEVTIIAADKNAEIYIDGKNRGKEKYTYFEHIDSDTSFTIKSMQDSKNYTISFTVKE